MYCQMNLLDSPNATFSPGSGDGLLPSDLPDGATSAECGQGVALANLSARQAKEMGLMTSGTCGLHSITSSASANLQSCLESKLQARLPTGGLTMFLKGWKRKVTPSGRRYCQLQRRVGGIPEIGCSLWATPNTMDSLPPRSSEAMERQFSTTRKGRTAPANLREQVIFALWPTPCAADDRDRGRWSNPSIQRRVAMGKQINLSMLAQGCGGSNAQMGTQGQLNPQFQCWLMGYPKTWLDALQGVLEMLSCQKSARNLSKRTLPVRKGVGHN